MFVIGIAGGTGSGKTTVVNQIINELPQNEVCILSQDSYYSQTDNLNHEERSKINFDHPKSIDFELLTKHLSDLKNNKTIQQPIYSFEKHNRINSTVKTLPKKVIIIEGILIFNSEAVRNLCDIKIFVHADADERLIRRVRRDIKERGRDVDEVLSRYQDTLKPMHQQFIEPTKSYADIIIPNDKYNTVAVDIVRTVITDRL
ncbi:uridine kinase [Tenacibaculum finnmarkense genomovar finnmarkense]|uniref:Uridine kinase n=1 Tax=Tenacibaculum finnmarkense genomovar finnmarkense TaxID=1458503 RepID=A0AAP1RFJ8_9FLAO|nr:uridine kinase [Tenacibaculum finnmarkense]MBE7652716.1 uridine kinase [Tenacibaculum finnmarkense genomovar finnmarkense]MBE7661306.1 uridine kinase [Tenacibaculum finnmarkense genomovar finnmarkense]MBE7693121.1 uridine kinase [Tenacibaculum finnmarkense genomovar finnmarkense]MBE7695007.1 uridine kinase [Tenacibaculum finnmarkense genomovar finnmarkense]MCD8403360.1 uridine kinase [Tenacibaculum finnmarkense genomovar finnmarkense]